MLRIISPVPPLDAAERHALDTLVDLSRLLVIEGGAGGAGEAAAAGGAGGESVELRVTESAEASTVDTLREGPRGGGVGGGGGLRPRDGGVEIPRALLRLVTHIVGGVREQRSTATDRHGRVPHSENDPARQGFEREPVVNRIAVALRRAVIEAAGRRAVVLVAPWPSGKRWAVAMTHDLDVVAGWPAFTALRIVELLGKAQLRRAARSTASAVRAIGRDPIFSTARDILSTERRLGMRSTWFIISGSATLQSIKAGDITYTVESRASRRIIDAALHDEHELALHGSFATLDAPRFFREQRDRLAALASAPIAGVRQHFIRMRPGTTHEHMAHAGFAYDSTFGFSDRNGFRLGVADVVRVWDDGGQRALGLDEVPFVWMDRALSKYRGVEDPDAWIQDALALAATCREVEGVWNGIWHPNLAPALGFPGAPAAFETLCEQLMAHAPWSASLGEIVRWRRARRTVRAVGEARADALRLRVPGGAAALALEDADGRPVPFTPV
ncbi:MAG: hypothetical protein WD801_15460 [Gemmatimonadaceae bacterium]